MEDEFFIDRDVEFMYPHEMSINFLENLSKEYKESLKMNKPKLLALAIKIAVNKHDSQFDKAGKPYIMHPLRVMAAVDSIDEKIVAILHDVLEDCFDTLEEGIAFLREQGFYEYHIKSLILLTRKKGQSNREYVFMIKADSTGLAKPVKIADMRDNSDLFRLHEIEDKHLRMHKKYHWSMKQLRDENEYLTSPR